VVPSTGTRATQASPPIDHATLSLTHKILVKQ